jgi:transcription elongation GreA/GreB family factor
MGIDKTHFISALRAKFTDQLEIARRAAGDAANAAANLATENEKREDSRAMIEFGSMSKAQTFRALRAREELEMLERFVKQGLGRFDRKTPIAMGALVDVRMETDAGEEERTFFLLPCGAGAELNGPGGDGFVSVITPASPVGKQLLGRRVGESIDVTIKGDTFEWFVVDAG